MEFNIAKESAALDKLSITELRQQYEDVFDEVTLVHNRLWLKKRILWRLQANAEGDISFRARQRALEIANDSDLRMSPPKGQVKACAEICSVGVSCATNGDKRLPMPGSAIKKQYKDQMLEVMVLENGFEFEGEQFDSLSAVANKITGTHLSGFAFFGLKKPRAK